MTLRDSSGAIVNQDQFCGRVLEVVDGLVVVERPEGNALLPSDPDAYEPAPPGRYVLAASGAEVIDPDYLTTWDVTGSPGPR